MKIAVSADCFAAYTSGFPVRGMMLELIRQNPNVHFQLYYTNRERPKELKNFYSEINSLPNVEVRYFIYSRKVIAIKRLLRLKYVKFDEDIDLFLNPGNPEYIRGYKGLSICSLADLSTIKGLSTNKYALFFKYWSRIGYNKTLPLLSRIVTISEFTRQDLKEFFPSVYDKTITVYNGIGDHWFRESKYKGVAKRYGIDSPYFIWWGLISRRKNIERLVLAYKNARQRKADLPKLLLVGKIAEHMEYLRHEFTSDIINIPFQDNDTLRALVCESEGLVFPSLYEGFGLPVVEAFSQGVNVACSNVTSLPEVSGGKALLFNPESIESISDAILELTKKHHDKDELMKYAQRFTYSNAARKYMEIIKSVVK